MLAASTTFAQNTRQGKAIYLDTSAPLEQRVEDALSRMTLEEKVKMTHAQSKFSSAGVPRLGIPDVWMSDGPHGVRPQVLWDEWRQAGWTNDSCVCFPALTCLAATWDPQMGVLYGNSIGEEALYRGKSMLLGPGVNINRTPLNGRNFEYMGEDPYLASRMVIPYITGLQDKGVAACVKHFALNNQEHERYTTNVKVSDRALYEIYLPAFRAAVQEAKTIGIMPSYNLFEDQQCGHNKRLLLDILKGEWQFDGVAVSDWGAVHSTEEAANNGLDMEFGTGTDGLSSGTKNAYDSYYLALPYLKGLKEGKYSVEGLNDKVRRILRFVFRTTMSGQRGFGSFCSDEHYAAARKIGAEGIVLLKNDKVLLQNSKSKNDKALLQNGKLKNYKELLPLYASDYQRQEGKPRLLVVGENAIKMLTVGGGSSNLKVQHEVTPIDGIRERFSADFDITYCRGYVGDPTGEYDGVITGQNLQDDRSPEALRDEAVKAAREADVVIYIGGLNKKEHQDCEGADRTQYELPYGQDALVEALAAANPRLVFLSISGNAFAMPWVKQVPAILQCWFMGSETGHSIADVLSGDVNPSGHLPYTWYTTLQQCGAHALGEYPGTKRADSNIWDEEYKEDIFVGYRYVDRQKLTPLFPFGHGLSYTTFQLGKAEASAATIAEGGKLTVTVPVTNTGSVAGAEVVQLYVSDTKCSVERPVRELKAFQKVFLQPGETRNATLTLTADAFKFFDEQAHDWCLEAGDFLLTIGTSSRNLPIKIKVKAEN